LGASLSRWAKVWLTWLWQACSKTNAGCMLSVGQSATRQAATPATRHCQPLYHPPLPACTHPPTHPATHPPRLRALPAAGRACWSPRADASS
jgi:hypothetical protein